jgi:hypothetical protein
MKRILSLLAGITLALGLSTSASAQSREIGAQSLMLDDGSGNTLDITYPNLLPAPVIGESYFTFPPGGGTGVPNGTINGMTLWWNSATTVWTADNFLTNTGTAIGINTATPTEELEVEGLGFPYNTPVKVGSTTNTVTGDLFLQYDDPGITANARYDNGYYYDVTASDLPAVLLDLAGGELNFYSEPAGAGGTAFTFSPAVFTVDPSGDVSMAGHVMPTTTATSVTGVTGDANIGATVTGTDVAGVVTLSSTFGSGHGSVDIAFGTTYTAPPVVVLTLSNGIAALNISRIWAVTDPSGTFFTLGYASPNTFTGATINYMVIQ